MTYFVYILYRESGTYMQQYYVYAYLNPLESGRFTTDNFSFLEKPFYIGKGKDGRMYDHLKECRLTRKFKNSHKLNTIRQILSIGVVPSIIKLYDGLSEEDAIRAEETLIIQLKNLYGLTNIRSSSWISGSQSTDKKKTFNNPRKNTVTIYNMFLKEHTVLKIELLPVFIELYGIINVSEIRTRIGTRKDKARFGSSNGMYRKTAVKGKRWCIINGEEKFLFPEEIDKFISLNYNVKYGRVYKPSGKRIIFEGELKGKYRNDTDIDLNSDKKYQYGLVWSHTKPTFINHKLI